MGATLNSRRYVTIDAASCKLTFQSETPSCQAPLFTVTECRLIVREYFDLKLSRFMAVCWEKGEDWSYLGRLLVGKVEESSNVHC